MNNLSSTAMVLAAGRGERMLPLTLTTPKPLLEVGGRTMLDRALDKLVNFGIKRAVVNACYLAEQIDAHLKTRNDIEIVVSHEKELLDTGGGVKNALAHFDGKPFFVLNADLPWIDGGTSALNRMAQKWHPVIMDVLLLLMATDKARGFSGNGDFAMEPDGRVHRKGLKPPRPFVMLSAQIVKPELFAHNSEKAFSNNAIWDEAETHQKLYGIEHEGVCYHVGTPGDLKQANELLASGRGWL